MINYKIKANAKKLRKDIIDMHKIAHGCCICGYNKCASALDFHHIDEDTKMDGVAALINNGASIDIISEEIKKCIILCANCHRELHNKK